MGNISINFSNLNKKNKVTKNVEKPKEKIILTYHDCIQEIPEYYTYIDSDNKEQIFSDNTYIINKVSSSKYVAKKNNVNKIFLTYIPGKENIEFRAAYFTYNNDKVYLDKPIYNEIANSYNGVLKSTVLYDDKIIIYEEK